MALHFTATVVDKTVGYNIKLVGGDVELYGMSLPEGYELYAKKSEEGATGKGLTYNGTPVSGVKLSGDTLQDLNASLKAQLFFASGIDDNAPAEASVENAVSFGGTALGSMTIADTVKIA